MASTAAPKPAPTAAVMLDVKSICESPFNPRQVFDKKKMEELAASIRLRGLLEPVKVRPSKKGKADYELIFGHRRLRAAAMAGLSQVPAIVAELTDEEVIVEQAIENHQRDDVHQLEEADQFQLLHEKFKRPVFDIAKEIGLSIEYVYARMKLCSLCPEGRKAFLAGDLLPSVALMVARIPSAKLQAAAVKELLDTRDGDPVGARAALDHIQRRYMLKLAEAPFKTDDPKLVPAAGPCNTCPHRTGNGQHELFGDVKGKDICTNPPCYSEKADAAWRQRAAAAKEQGTTVLSDQAAKVLYPHGTGDLVYNAPVIDLSAKCQDDPKGRTYKQLLGKAPTKIAVVRDPRGQVHEVIEKKDIPAALKAAGVELPKRAPVGASDQEWRRKEADKARAKRAAGRALIAEVLARAEKAPLDDKLFRLIATGAILQSAHEALIDVLNRRGWSEKGGAPEKIAEAKIAILKGADLRGFLLEVLLSRGAFYVHQSGYGEALEEGCKLYGVDQRKVIASAKEAAPKATKASPAKAAKKSTRKK